MGRGRNPGEQTAAGTNLFTDLNARWTIPRPTGSPASSWSPTDRCTTCRSPPHALGFDAPVHALFTGKPDEFDRRIEVLEAPRYGIVGQSRDDRDCGARNRQRLGVRNERVTLKVRREGRPDETRTRRDRPHCQNPHALPARRPEHRRDRARDGARRTDRRQQSRGRSRPKACAKTCACCWSRANRTPASATWRNLLKSDAAVDLVHFTILAAAAEAGRHADQSAVADRVPDARAVLGEDQGIRPDHLRSLPAPRHSAAALLRQHRPLRGQQGGALLVAAGDDYAGA